jgi:hypothetical protein
MRRLLCLIFLLGISLSARSQSMKCENNGGLPTPKGKITDTTCHTSDLQSTYREIWSLNEKPLVSGKYPIQLEDANKENTLIVLQGASNSNTGCPDQTFLIDLTGISPRVFSFGIKNACSEYHWAKWSKNKRSVIALKNNVRFTYVNGKLIPPDDTDSDQFGSPILGEFITLTPSTPPIPFVKELTLPK